MKNVTITVEDSVLDWARIEAARRGTSVSRMLGDFMAEMQQREDAYERAYLAWRTDERTWQADESSGTVVTAAVASARRTSGKRTSPSGVTAAAQRGGDAA